VAQASPEKVRRCIDRGLARYGRGELRQAIVDWHEALALDPGNKEAHTLIEFVQRKISAEGDPAAMEPDKRPTAPAMEVPTFEDDWNADEETESHSPGALLPEMSADDIESLEEDAPTGTHRVRSHTIESPIPKLLATMTDPEWKPPALREEAAPDAELFDEDTRRLGSEPHVTPVGPPPGRVPSIQSPAEDSAREVRLRAAELVDQCRGYLERGNLEAAAVAAEAALREGEHAPDPGIPEVIEPARSLFERAFEGYIGPATGVPVTAMSAGALTGQDLDHRAGFLLSRIDGHVSIDALLDIASMPRFEALRILASLLRVKAIRLEH
jgi:hypothetical protein